ncbi:thiamine-phosphate kinase [Elongatibacter sediminis]|uniref:Thiamine-monophosphate kinase n=1 Tax=Elongatibacter sediminis TaxID=3119006 RepID=A0AAW9R8D4_9GAMM
MSAEESTPKPGEFDLIRHLADAAGRYDNDVPRPAAVGIGDDAAVLDVDPGCQLVVTTDTLVAGVHFEADAAPGDIGYKALAVNLSDLAAMGATPAWHFLNLTGPPPDREWLGAFAAGMGELAGSEGTQLAGGDTTGGPMSVTVTALGQVPRGQALLRSTAQPGDRIVVSGMPGLAARALRWPERSPALEDAATTEAFRRLHRPRPRLALGRCLRGVAHACIDISDGLAADLGHILDASGLGAELWLDRLPDSPVFSGMTLESRWNLQLGGGDDYELCFTVPDAAGDLSALEEAAGVALTVIGRIRKGAGLDCIDADGAAFSPRTAGWDHFRSDPA